MTSATFGHKKCLGKRGAVQNYLKDSITFSGEKHGRKIIFGN